MLIDELPDTAGGLAINTDFRYMLQIDALLRDKEIPGREKIMLALGIFYKQPEKITDVEKSVDDLLDFFLCGEKPKQGSGGGSGKRIYDFEQDAPYIYASFRQAYGINLATDSLHWWEFTALFSALPDDCIMSKIMSYRGMDLKGMKGKQKRFYEDMQARYRLDRQDEPQYNSTQDRDAAYKALVDRRFAEAERWKKENENK